MAYERLQGLGEEKFGKILNALMRGEPAMALAREIQQKWGDFQDVAEKTLTQQLNRLRLDGAKGAFGMETAKEIAKIQITQKEPPQIKALAKLSPAVLERLEDLTTVQLGRLNRLVEKEKAMPVPVGAMLTATNAVFNDYKQLLLDIQKVRFDLGVDEFKGPIGGGILGIRGQTSSVTLPDGTNLQKQVFEAVQAVESVFEQRKIPMKDVTP